MIPPQLALLASGVALLVAVFLWLTRPRDEPTEDE